MSASRIARAVARIAAAACLAAAAGAAARPIATTAAPVDSLADGRTGTIAFRSQTPRSTDDYVRRADAAPATVTGELWLPARVQGRVPAVVILHGSAGVTPGEWAWAARMNALGYASLVVDSFWGRGVGQTVTDQTRLPMVADIADAYAALRLLATHPAIDPRRVAVMGFSRGGVAALYSALEPMRGAAAGDELRFAAHVALDPSCGIHYSAAHLDGAPLLMLLGGRDDYTPAAPCLAYAQGLRARGATVATQVYPDGFHAFDRPVPRHVVEDATSARDCDGEHDLDTGVFTMAADGRRVTGAAAVQAAHDCLRRGVTLGGDPRALAEAPGAVASFLHAAFAGPH